MAPKANKNPSANSFATLAPKETKDLPPAAPPKVTMKTDAGAVVERKIEEFFQQRMKTSSAPQNGPTSTQATKRRVNDVEAIEPSPSPTKRAAREDDMDTDDAVEELVSPQVTPKQQAHTASTTWDLATPVLSPSLPQDKLTPTPRDGFPKIYGLSLKKLAGNITKDTKEVWNSLEGPIVLIMVAYAKPTKGFSASYVAKLSPTITSVIGISEDPTVTPSELAITKFPTLPQPFTVTGILSNQADTLTWIKAESNRNNIPAQVTTDKAAEFITESITASTIEIKENGKMTTVFRIHGFPPRTITTLWTTILHH
ncbi:hypothetical protein H1R20_g757, partial [Candolleomyces eurysporus]